jgi:hypothetical protein
MTTTQPLTGPLKKSGARIGPRGKPYVVDTFRKYAIESYATYVDQTTVLGDLPDLDIPMLGYYSFDGNMKGAGSFRKQQLDSPIRLLSLEGPLPKCAGWLIASTSRASAFSVAKALLRCGAENQIICRLYGGQTTKAEAYMDMLSGDTETLMYVTHYYDRKYRIVFPLDIRYTVCQCNGTVVRSGQRIVPPGGLTVFDSREMKLGDFQGYLRVELEVENLQTRVQPFIHFWADYISDSGISRNHQAGWAPWPAGTVFNRGILPVKGLDAVASFYNVNKEPANVKAMLHYNKGGSEKKLARALEPIKPGHMAYRNLSDEFKDLDMEGVEAAYVLLACNKPLHRPNHYLAVKGTKQYVETYHQTGGAARHWADNVTRCSGKELSRMTDLGLSGPWSIRLPILEEHYNIETYLGLLSLTLAQVSECNFAILDADGDKIFSAPARLSGQSPQFMNVNKFARDNYVDIGGGGAFVMDPPRDGCSKSAAVFFGLKHTSFPFITTSFRGAPGEVNLPFYLSSTVPKSREYDTSPLVTSDHFAPGICSNEFDSLMIVEYQPVGRCTRVGEYRLDILDAEGRQYSQHRTIKPRTYDVFWLSEVLEQLGIASCSHYYTLWFKSYDVKLKPFHSLYRRSDHALNLDDGSEGTLQSEPQV